MRFNEEQKERIINALANGFRESYGDVKETLKLGIPKLFEHFETNSNEEYEGDIVLMFCQEELKELYEKGYRWM